MVSLRENWQIMFWRELILLLLLQIFFFFFFFFVMKAISWSLSRENQAGIIEAFNSTSRYLDDLLNIDNGYASLFNCTTAVRASDSMTASS